MASQTSGTKIEAFKDRGYNDFLASPDMEDIISVLEVSPKEIFEGMLDKCSEDFVKYLKKEFKSLLSNNGFLDALPGALFNRESDLAVQAIKERMAKIGK